MRRRRSIVGHSSGLLAVLAAAGLTACSGSGSTVASMAAKQPAGRANASFVMHWPGLHASSGVRRLKYISPATKSVAIEVNGDATLTKKVDTPVTNGQPQTSTIAFEAPVGDDTITFSLWDQPGATGNELGQATIAVTIASGKTNTVNATIDGLIASVDFIPLPNQPTVASATDPSGATTYTISGDLPVTFAAAAKDADGNVIIANGSPIAYSATASTAVFALSPVAGQANQFIVRAEQPPAQGAKYAIVAHATDGQGGLGQSNYRVSLAELTYIAYENAGAGTIAAFDASGTRIPLAGAFPGLKDPVGLAYDGRDHRLYVVDKATGSLLAYQSDGTPVSGYAAPALAGMNGVALDTHTMTLYVSSSSDAVRAYTVDGAPVATPGGFPLLARPVGIFYYDPISALFVANAGNNTVSHYGEDGSTVGLGPMRRAAYSTGSVVPASIGGDGSGLFVVGGNDGTSDLLTEFLITGVPPASGGTTTSGVAAPAGIAYDLSTGDFYVADNASGNVTVYDRALSGLVKTIAAPSAFSQPTSLTFIF
jgi:hypothetical protein